MPKIFSLCQMYTKYVEKAIKIIKIIKFSNLSLFIAFCSQ